MGLVRTGFRQKMKRLHDRQICITLYLVESGLNVIVYGETRVEYLGYWCTGVSGFHGAQQTALQFDLRTV
jgi:hypothetical protein